MTNVIGEIVYKYTLRNEKLNIHEGEIILDYCRKYVNFKCDSSRVRCPKENEFGVVHTNGPTVWMTKRDDDLVKRLFIEFEERKIAELQAQINTKTKLIKMLKEDSV
jgi:hypothetical protein